MLQLSYCFISCVVGQTLLALVLWVTKRRPSCHSCKAKPKKVVYYLEQCILFLGISSTLAVFASGNVMCK